MTTDTDTSPGDPLAPHALVPRELKRLLETERGGCPFFVYRDQLGELCVFVPSGSTAGSTVGRREEADLVISWDAEVSGLHAEIQVLSGELTIVDDGLSTNGTFVNGQRIRGRQRLRDGDRIRVGQTVLVYKSSQASPAMRTAAAIPKPDLLAISQTQRRVLVALCRPFYGGDGFTTPATNQQIADEVFLSVDAVKMHLRALFGKFGLASLPQNQKRAKLAEHSLQLGVVTERDLA